MKLTFDFWRGVAVVMFVQAAYQDHLGLDGYIEQCKAHWTAFPNWMPIIWMFLAGLILGWPQSETKP